MLDGKSFIDQGCKAFFDQLDSLHKSDHFYEYIWRFTENSFINVFIQGLTNKFGQEHFHYITELGSTTGLAKDKQPAPWGRLDLLVDDIQNNQLFVIESKSFWSHANEPDTKHWEEEATAQYYLETLIQAKKYILDEPLFKNRKVTAVALTFSRVEFNSDKDKELLPKWTSQEDVNPDEFYSFKTYEHNKGLIGVAVYGKFESLNVS